MNEKDITALISLLDDPDEEIFSHRTSHPTPSSHHADTDHIFG